jgi:hypothetical protein
MSEADYEAAVAAFLRTKGVTRCPTVCVVPTQATVAEADRAAYRDYVAAKEAARLEKLKTLQQILHLSPAPPMNAKLPVRLHNHSARRRSGNGAVI